MADSSGIKLPAGATLTKSLTMSPSAPQAPKLPDGATLTRSPVAASPGTAAAPPVPSGAGAAAPTAESMIKEGAQKVKALGFNANPAKATTPTFDEFMKSAEAWARGISQGTSDDATAALAAAILKRRGDPRSMYDLYKQLDAVENERINAGEEASPARSVAELIGSFQTPGLKGMGQWVGDASTGLGSMARAAGVGMGVGGVSGWGYADPGSKTKGTTQGAAVGGFAGAFLDRIAGFIGPKISQAAQYLRGKGVRPTIGQNVGGAAKALEEKVSSIPLAGDLIKNQQRAAIEDFNRAAYNEVLAPIGKSVPKDFKVGNQGFAKVDDMISAEYQKLLPKLTFTADAQFKTDIAAIDRLASMLPEAQQKAYINIMNTQFAGKLDPATHTMTGNVFKGAESELSDEIRGLSNDPSWDQKKLGRVLKMAQQVMRNTLERTNPAYAGQLQPINRATMMLKRLQDAVERIGAKDGIIMPSHLLSASNRGGVGKQFARGSAPFQDLAQAGDAVLSNKYPDSGTAGRILIPMLAGGAAALNPKVAAGVGAATIPYLLPRGWNASPFAQGSSALLRQTIPYAGSQIGGEIGEAQ